MLFRSQEGGDSSSEHLEIEGVTEGGWIQWFCSFEGNEFFVEIDEDFIRDPISLYGLRHKIEPSRFKECVDFILSPYMPTEQDLQNEK